MKKFDLSLYVMCAGNERVFVKYKSVKTNSSRYAERKLIDMYVYSSILVNNKTNKVVAISEDDNGDLEYLDMVSVEDFEKEWNIKLKESMKGIM